MDAPLSEKDWLGMTIVNCSFGFVFKSGSMSLANSCDDGIVRNVILIRIDLIRHRERRIIDFVDRDRPG